MSASSRITGVSSKPVIDLSLDTPELATTYDKVGVRQFDYGKELIRALNISTGEHVLDIGAGTGHLAAYVGKIVGLSGRVVGIDPLPLRIEIAQSKASGNFEARVGRVEDLSQFADESFDVVYLNSVFHWVEDKPRALAEIVRVLKTDGRLGLNCRDADHPPETVHFVQHAATEAGVEVDRALDDLGLSGHQLETLVTGAGFVGYGAELRTFVNFFQDVDALLALRASSGFGNFLVNVSEVGRARIRGALGRLLEPKRLAGEDVRLEIYLTFATARKPHVE
jgi:SAM-dependent methyltransferase